MVMVPRNVGRALEQYRTLSDSDVAPLEFEMSVAAFFYRYFAPLGLWGRKTEKIESKIESKQEQLAKLVRAPKLCV
jgi:hypothetical protein